MHPSAPATAPPRTDTALRSAWPGALALDVLAVALFAGIGRNAHSLSAAGLLETAWPFLTGLLAGWAVWRLPRAPFSVWPRGVALWLTTVAVGMLLRVLVGEGAAQSFLLVTLAVLAVLLLGPRCLVRLLHARRNPRSR